LTIITIYKGDFFEHGIKVNMNYLLITTLQGCVVTQTMLGGLTIMYPLVAIILYCL